MSILSRFFKKKTANTTQHYQDGEIVWYNESDMNDADGPQWYQIVGSEFDSDWGWKYDIYPVDESGHLIEDGDVMELYENGVHSEELRGSWQEYRGQPTNPPVWQDDDSDPEPPQPTTPEEIAAADQKAADELRRKMWG